MLFDAQDFLKTVPAINLGFVFESLPEDMFIDFRDGGGGRKGGRERQTSTDVREKHQSVASCTHPDQESKLQPRPVPLPGT